MRIILASASPRRQELLAGLFKEFEVIPAEGREISAKTMPEEIVQELAYQKASEVAQRLFPNAGKQEDYLVIGADTVVAAHGQILGKPKDAEDAKAMLRILSAATHQVYTGAALIFQKDGKRECINFSEQTDVSFYPMTETEIAGYVRTGEPMDKAGSYGIQGIGGRFVAQIRGDYNNVVGLPVAKIYQVLKRHMKEC